MAQVGGGPSGGRLDACCEWLDRTMALVYGDGDRTPVQAPHPRSADRLEGAAGEWVTHHDGEGRAYLSAA